MTLKKYQSPWLGGWVTFFQILLLFTSQVCFYPTGHLNWHKKREIHARCTFTCRRMQMNIWKIIYLNCGEEYEFAIDHRIYTHSWGSCEIVWILHLLRVYYELTKWRAPRWLNSSVDRALHRHRRNHGLNILGGSNYNYTELIIIIIN